MMTSFVDNIPAIVNAVTKYQPMSILDIGPAFGKYGLLIREAYLSIKAEQGQLEPIDDIKIDCVEMAKYFIDRPALHAIYDKVYPFDIREFHSKKNSAYHYDMALMIDVVEHWDKKTAKGIIRDFANAGTRVLVSTPRQVHMYKEDYYGKDCPKHETQWDAQDFLEITPGAANFSTKDSWIFIV